MKQNDLLFLALKQMFDNPAIPCNKYRFISPEIGFVRSIRGTVGLTDLFFIFGRPYRLTEGRIVLMKSGFIRAYVNLAEVTFSAHQLVIASPGTVVQLLEVSKNCELEMLGFANSLLEDWQWETFVRMYLQGRLNTQITLLELEEKRVRQFFDILWEVLHDEPFPKDVVRSLMSALFHQIDVYRTRERAEENRRRTRQEEVFNRFLSLVNKYAVCERNIGFYAENLYLTPRYLSTLIKQISGRTVMDWINEAVIQEAKLRLRHSDKLIYQVADELNFPNASFFCKYFRRMVGKTPYEYRQEE